MKAIIVALSAAVICSLIFWQSGIPLLDGPTYRLAQATRSLWNYGTLAAPEYQDLEQQVIKRSLATTETVWQDAYSLGADHKLYPKHAPLAAILATPLYGVFGEAGFWILTQIAFVFLVYSFLELSGGFKTERKTDWALTLALVGTQSLFLVYGFSYDLIGAALILGGFLLAQKDRETLGSMLMVLSLNLRPAHLILIVFLFAFVWSISKRRVALINGLCLGGIVLSFINFQLYGSPEVFSYLRIPAYEAGMRVLLAHPMGFDWSVFGREWFEKLFSTKHGWLTYNLGLILVPVALLKKRLTRMQLFACIAALSFTLFIFSYVYWDASNLGNRFLLPATYLLLLPVVRLAEHKSEAA